ncbi:MAG: TIR domain-containing protein [Thermomicrobiales bacterium]
MSTEDPVTLPRRQQTITLGERLIEERRSIATGYSRAFEWLGELTDAEYRAYEARWLEWHRVNVEVLKRMFDTSTIADEYGAICIDYYSKHGFRHYHDERLDQLERFLNTATTALESINDRLLLYPGPEDKPPALVTGIVDGKDNVRKARRPRVFIASSVDGLDISYALQTGVERHLEPTVWDQGVFEPSRYILETLEGALDNFDYAVFVFSPADTIIFKGEEQKAVRDNVIFELGLFIGRLGRAACFVVHPRIENLHLPSDLLAFQTLTYENERQDDNFEAALGPVASRIRQAIARHQKSIASR